MAWGLLNLGMLFGLGAVAIPVLVHLLRRRRHDVVQWGAMQFLPTTASTRQRRFWDELPLMVARIGIVALLVTALAGPYATSAVFAPLSERPARDVVLVLDGSYSMGQRNQVGETPWAEACRWADEHIAQLGRGERAALVVARRPPLLVQAELTADRSLLRSQIAGLPPPRGNAGLPQALAEAWRLLQPPAEASTQDRAAAREIIILTDRQHFGWADEATRRQWDAVAGLLRAEGERLQAAGQAMPSLTVIDVAGDRLVGTANFALGPLAISRALVPVGQGVKFTTTLHRTGPRLPRAIRVSVDGIASQTLAVPDHVDSATAIPLSFTQRLDRPGMHVVTVTIDPGDAPDALAVDNEQYAVVEAIAELPVLLVDGDAQVGPESSTYFLDKALAGTDKKRSVVAPRVVSHKNLTAAHLLNSKAADKPRVVVLADVPSLSDGAQAALTDFVKEGGGVLVMLGPRAGKGIALYNDGLYRTGRGWLPARLVEVPGGATASMADPGSFQHPALELFRKGLGEIAFPRWWKVGTGEQGAGAVVARLSNGDPLLIEKRFGKGRTILCSVPPDRGWDSPLPGAWEFPVLAHELIYYLASARTSAWLLDDGQPLVIGPGRAGAAPGRLIVTTPEVPSRTVAVRDWPWTDPQTGAIGLYRIERDDGSGQAFVVPPDLRESEDRRCTDAEWAGVLQSLPLVASESPDVLPQHELWWLALLGVIALLCVEVFLTRRLAVARRSTAPMSHAC